MFTFSTCKFRESSHTKFKRKGLWFKGKCICDPEREQWVYFGYGTCDLLEDLINYCCDCN